MMMSNSAVVVEAMTTTTTAAMIEKMFVKLASHRVPNVHDVVGQSSHDGLVCR